MCATSPTTRTVAAVCARSAAESGLPKHGDLDYPQAVCAVPLRASGKPAFRGACAGGAGPAAGTAQDLAHELLPPAPSDTPQQASHSRCARSRQQRVAGVGADCSARSGDSPELAPGTFIQRASRIQFQSGVEQADKKMYLESKVAWGTKLPSPAI